MEFLSRDGKSLCVGSVVQEAAVVKYEERTEALRSLARTGLVVALTRFCVEDRPVVRVVWLELDEFDFVCADELFKLPRESVSREEWFARDAIREETR
jgi:hypothetical protein